MPRYKLIVEYEGTPYVGWQRQKVGRSVQQTIEEAITLFCQENPNLTAAGRTDAGVHAWGQVAHFDTIKTLDPYRIVMGLNAYLRDQAIRIIKAEQVDTDFHARFSALSRSYRYVVLNRMAPAGIERNHVYHVFRKLDLNAMQQASQLLLGQHDFSTFRALSCQAKSPIRSITDFSISHVGERFYFDVTAPSFLHHQIRNIVGSLLYVGTGKWSIADFEAAFKAADRRVGGPTAPPQGLYFMRVIYEDTQSSSRIGVGDEWRT